MKICSFIPARGGSKGIPYKNIANLCQQPLIKYVIDTSRFSQVDETWVSTDDIKIKKISLLCGANVIDRPSDISGDTVSTEFAIRHFVDNVECDVIVFMQATSPLTLPMDINNGIEKIKTGEFDSLFSAVVSNDILFWDNELKPINYDPNNRGNRQTRKGSTYIETGNFYIFTKESFLKHNCRLGGRIGFVEIPFWRSFEIDTKEDLQYIAKLIKC